MYCDEVAFVSRLSTESGCSAAQSGAETCVMIMRLQAASAAPTWRPPTN